MKLPRDSDAAALLTALQPLGYRVTRQTGSHLRITTRLGGEHHRVIPNHRPLRLGTLQAVPRRVAAHRRMPVADLLAMREL